MPRLLLRAAIGAVLVFVIPLLVVAGPDDDPRVKDKIEVTLAVQSALRQGRDQLQKGNYQSAVFALEREVSRCNADKDYLLELERAYRGYCRELQQGHHEEEAAKYLNRLAALDPGSRLEPHTPPTLAALATQPGPAAAPVKQPEVRGALDYKAAAVSAPASDPFSDANRAPRDVQTVITHANQEFEDKHYQCACRLYQEAHTLDPNATTPCRQKWAYCKLDGVVEALNQPTVTVAPEDLEREVRQAMSLAPELDTYSQKLLRTLQERLTPGKPLATERVEELTVPMHHVGKLGEWSVLETPSFRILHNQPREVAEKAGKIVEQTRKSMSKKWFGDEGENWGQRCDVYLHATGQDYARATGASAQVPGHSTIRAEGERVMMRRVDLHCDDPNWPIGVLPHETTHVILAGRFGGKAVPRWADEGMAVLSEPRDRIERHLRNLPMHRDNRELFNVGQLMEMNEYPRPQLIGPFYAESVSVVEYLSSLKGPSEYTAFLRDGLRSGYEPSLKKHFGIEGYADLDRRWQAYAFKQQSASARE
jgi:tetratricopeptide (TPR) repeat protein